MSESRAQALGSASLLQLFRANPKKRPPLHPLERAVLAMVAVHLCFLPWALGTMHPWSQVTSLGLAAIGFALAMLPRTYAGDYALATTNRPSPRCDSQPTPATDKAPIGHHPLSCVFRLNPWLRLRRFPIFWIGLALLAYIVTQGINPSWVFQKDEKFWWLRRVNDIAWLPTSIDTPWGRFNLWRQLIIYASTWLTVCTVWVGFTRRRSLEILFGVLAINSAVLAITGFVFRAIRDPQYVLWYEHARPGILSFSSFIYKNHAGAWLALMAATFVFLAVGRHQRSLQQLERSNPAVTYLLGAILMLVAEIFTYSRGGTALLAGYLLLAFALFLLKRLFTRSAATTHPLVPASVSVMVLITLSYGASQLDYRDAELRFAEFFKDKITDANILHRQQANLASMEYLRDTWPRGVGAGGFRFYYPEYVKKYPDIHNSGRFFWEHAHNDWLQIPIELGAAGCGLLLLSAGWWLTRLLRQRVWRDLPSLLLCLGLAQTLLHAIFDFPFQNPAILITWCALAILALRRLEFDKV